MRSECCLGLGNLGGSGLRCRKEKKAKQETAINMQLCSPHLLDT
jgi:hypothetical protein